MYVGWLVIARHQDQSTTQTLYSSFATYERTLIYFLTSFLLFVLEMPICCTVQMSLSWQHNSHRTCLLLKRNFAYNITLNSVDTSFNYVLSGINVPPKKQTDTFLLYHYYYFPISKIFFISKGSVYFVEMYNTMHRLCRLKKRLI